MESRTSSVVSIFKIREIILEALAIFFKTRADFSFFSPESKENKVWLMDEESENPENKNAYPRLVLYRNGSSYKDACGFNDSHEGHEFFNTMYSRGDILVHNFTIRVIAQGHMICEGLAYLTSTFIRFFSKEIVNFKNGKIAFNAQHRGLSNIERLTTQEEKRPLFRCDINFVIEDNEIMLFQERTDERPFGDVEIQIITPNIVCT